MKVLIADRLSESHRRQFEGEDWQEIAISLALNLDDDDEFRRLTSAPAEDCDCGFCATAEWTD